MRFHGAFTVRSCCMRFHGVFVVTYICAWCRQGGSMVVMYALLWCFNGLPWCVRGTFMGSHGAFMTLRLFFLGASIKLPRWYMYCHVAFMVVYALPWWFHGASLVEYAPPSCLHRQTTMMLPWHFDRLPWRSHGDAVYMRFHGAFMRISWWCVRFSDAFMERHGTSWCFH